VLSAPFELLPWLCVDRPPAAIPSSGPSGHPDGALTGSSPAPVVTREARVCEE
jgi:hypothetical protein